MMRITSIEVWIKNEGTGETINFERDFSYQGKQSRGQIEAQLSKWLDIIYMEETGDKGKTL